MLVSASKPGFGIALRQLVKASFTQRIIFNDNIDLPCKEGTVGPLQTVTRGPS
jgi:hypothetical protein